MAKELLWSEDCTVVYGWARDFKNQSEFIETVKKQNEVGECTITDIRKEQCISTEEGIKEDTVVPLRLSDIEIELFYTARVEQVE